MRRTTIPNPSLPLLQFLATILCYASIARAESVAEAAIRPRHVIDSRNNVQLPAARAAQAELAAATLAARNGENALVERQNYYAFSGAIYIVGAGGQSLSGLNAASPAYCPNNAPQSCGNIQVWNWCCPAGNTCEWADWAQTYVGCCPSGYTCAQGSLNQNAIQTVTVYVTTTQYAHGGGGPTIAAAGGQTTTWNNGGGGGGGGIVVVGTTTAPVTYNGYCTTIYAQNVHTPTQAAVPCGVALVVNGASRTQIGPLLLTLGALWTSMLTIPFAPRLLR